MAYNRRDDDLAYGDYHGQGQGQAGEGEGAEGERGLIGDVGRRFFGKHGEQVSEILSTSRTLPRLL